MNSFEVIIQRPLPEVWRFLAEPARWGLLTDVLREVNLLESNPWQKIVEILPSQGHVRQAVLVLRSAEKERSLSFLLALPKAWNGLQMELVLVDTVLGTKVQGMARHGQEARTLPEALTMLLRLMVAEAGKELEKNRLPA